MVKLIAGIFLGLLLAGMAAAEPVRMLSLKVFEFSSAATAMSGAQRNSIQHMVSQMREKCIREPFELVASVTEVQKNLKISEEMKPSALALEFTAALRVAGVPEKMIYNSIVSTQHYAHQTKSEKPIKGKAIEISLECTPSAGAIRRAA
ncbi:hypothetical protein [Paucibacter sp. DJ2R-2]|uniref:hypothetical protein n=1 Tax=Paucibacter sp. DJ2R-2 TaxID=2893558 RepID=UPI0021E40E70|nr:hypothetical protein [Paucibacter sp. DJ2R-2]MCV2423672.1 hypothetical protein [Paucibacter sp. DJ4R-1]MCV2441519.1 hypothetical protein [Paucibacter sp. DJ2R-2]